MTGLIFFFFNFGLPFRQRNATCKLAATEDCRVLHKIMFRGDPIISIVFPTECLERLWINLIKQRQCRWVTGFNFFCLGRICFLGLIYCDRRRLLFFGVHIRLLTGCKICFTLALSNYFSVGNHFPSKVSWIYLKVNWLMFIVLFKLSIY